MSSLDRELSRRETRACAGVYVKGYCDAREIPTKGLELEMQVERDSEKHRAAELCAVKKHILEPPVFGDPDGLKASTAKARPHSARRRKSRAPQLRPHMLREHQRDDDAFAFANRMCNWHACCLLQPNGAIDSFF
jgi:hypothetical protein